MKSYSSIELSLATLQDIADEISRRKQCRCLMTWQDEHGEWKVSHTGMSREERAIIIKSLVIAHVDTPD